MEIIIFSLVLFALGCMCLIYALHTIYTPSSKSLSLEDAQNLFLVQYGYLWCDGGIVSLGCRTAMDDSPDCLVVGIESSADAWNAIPDVFHGYPVVKQWEKVSEPL